MNLKSKIESLLFIGARPISARALGEICGLETEEIAKACEEISREYESGERGWRLVKNGSSYQLVTSPDNAEEVQKFINDETSGELSRPSLETLTIIAYRGPISKTDIDRIRGLNCSIILNNLSLRGLVEAKSDPKKDEVYYTISFDFLRLLGLNSIKELPDYEKLNANETINEILAENKENINNSDELDELSDDPEKEADEETEENDEDEEDEDGEDEEDSEDQGEESDENKKDEIN